MQSTPSTALDGKVLLDRLALTRRGTLEVVENGTPLYAPTPRLGSLDNPGQDDAGRGAAVAPVQLVAAFAALVNGGSLLQPTLMLDSTHVAATRVFSSRASRLMRRFLVRGVTVGMTGHASPPGPTILHPTLLSTSPAGAPEYVVYLLLDNPPPAHPGEFNVTLRSAKRAVVEELNAMASGRNGNP